MADCRENYHDEQKLTAFLFAEIMGWLDKHLDLIRIFREDHEPKVHASDVWWVACSVDARFCRVGGTT
jgi:hypothetical protein